MGHWSESLADEAAQRIGDSPDRRVLKDVLAQVGRELEVLSGRSFHPLRRATSVIEPNGLLFVDVPDLQVGSMEPVVGVWAVPDPVNRQTAAVLQVEPLPDLAPEAAPVAEALWLAGQLVAQASQTGRLSGGYVLHLLGASIGHEQRMELMRRVMDPAVRLSLDPPIRGCGWWFLDAAQGVGGGRSRWVTRSRMSGG
jgi:hypothetical protein